MALESLCQLVLAVLQSWMVALKWDDQERDLYLLLMKAHDLHLLLLQNNVVVLKEDLHLPFLRKVMVLKEDHDLLDMLDHDLLDHHLLYHDLLCDLLDHDHDLLALPEKECHNSIIIAFN
jgi:hypothetical protein